MTKDTRSTAAIATPTAEFAPAPASRLRSALAFAAAGLPVFPVQEKGKAPTLVRRGHNAASTNPARVRAWLEPRPSLNYGIALAPAGVFVLDLDRHAENQDGPAELERLEGAHGPLPATLEVETGTGRHVFLRLPPDSEAKELRGALAPGIDVKHRGYVVGPGSVHPSGRRYRVANGSPESIAEAPRWLLELLAKDQTRTGPAPSQTGPVPAAGLETSPRALAYYRATERGELDAIAQAPEGARYTTTRDASLRLLSVAKTLGCESTAAESLSAAGLAAGLDASEVARAVRSAQEKAEPRDLSHLQEAPPRQPPTDCDSRSPHAGAGENAEPAELAAARAWLEGEAWSGRGGRSERAVAAAWLQALERSGGEPTRVANDTARLAAGLARKTYRKARDRMLEREGCPFVLGPVERKPRGLGYLPRRVSIAPVVVPKKPHRLSLGRGRAYGAPEASQLSSAFSWEARAAGLPGATDVLRVLAESASPMSPGEIREATPGGVGAKTVRRALGELLRLGALEQTQAPAGRRPGLYALAPDLDPAALVSTMAEERAAEKARPEPERELDRERRRVSKRRAAFARAQDRARRGLLPERLAEPLEALASASAEALDALPAMAREAARAIRSAPPETREAVAALLGLSPPRNRAERRAADRAARRARATYRARGPRLLRGNRSPSSGEPPPWALEPTPGTLPVPTA